jgi:uncharacterized protein (DUF1697 family)
MTRFVALLRAVNLGGHNMLPMTELKAMCERVGFADAQTYIASGNVVFGASGDEQAVKAALEAQIEAFAGKRIEVLVRTAAEMQAVLEANPFAAMKPNRVVAIFLDERPAPDALDHVTGKKDEDIRLGVREIYVHYGEGMATSRLKIKAATGGTGRNINTVAKLAAMAKSPA